jgi:hypothetical protein
VRAAPSSPSRPPPAASTSRRRLVAPADARAAPYPARGRDRLLHGRARYDLQHRRRIRLREIDAGAHGGRPAAADRRALHFSDITRARRHDRPAARADDFSGPLRLAEPALARRRHHCRADPRIEAAPGRGGDHAARRRPPGDRRPVAQRRFSAIRMPSPAASASASRLRVRSRPRPISWSATSRPRRSTSPCRRRFST